MIGQKRQIKEGLQGTKEKSRKEEALFLRDIAQLSLAKRSIQKHDTHKTQNFVYRIDRLSRVTVKTMETSRVQPAIGSRL